MIQKANEISEKYFYYNKFLKKDLFVKKLKEINPLYRLKFIELDSLIKILKDVSTDQKIEKSNNLQNKLKINKKYWKGLKEIIQINNSLEKQIKESEEKYINFNGLIDINMKEIEWGLRIDKKKISKKLKDSFSKSKVFKNNLKILKVLILKIAETRSQNLELFEGILEEFKDKFKQEYLDKFEKNRKDKLSKKTDGNKMKNKSIDSKIAEINDKMKFIEESLSRFQI